ncbi:hypothetical protein EJD97_011121, partial [Solanum chilense]
MVEVTSSSSKNTAAQVEQIDASHPFFLAHSDSPGMNLINTSFDGSNFGSWKRGILISLSAKNKLGFINGTCKCPENESTMYVQWRRCNDMVLSWLLNALSKEIAESVLYSQTAAELWEELEERYGQADGTKLFQLQRELNNIKQGSYAVAGYFTKLKRLWDQMKELNTFMTCNCECKCGAKTHNHKMNEDQKLIQFLMGLNESFNAIRGHILMMKPLPSASQAYSICMHEESQRQVHSNTQVSTDSTAFLASARSPQKWTPSKKNSENRRGQQSGVLDGKRTDLYCRYCKKTNHVKDNCYKLIGYPPHYQFNKQKKGENSDSYAHVVNSDEVFNSGNGGNNLEKLRKSHLLIKEQCDKVAQVFQSMQGGDSGSAHSEACASANLAGTTTAPSMKKEPLFGEANAGLYVMKRNTSQKYLASRHPLISVQHSNVVANVPSPLYSASYPQSVYPSTLCQNVLNS